MRCGNRGCLETLVAAPRLLGLLQPAYDEALTLIGRSGSRATATPACAGCSPTPAAPSGGRVADLANSLNPERVVVAARSAPRRRSLDRAPGSIDRYAQPDTAEALEVVAGESATAPRWSAP